MSTKGSGLVEVGKDARTPYALHIADKSRILHVVAVAAQPILHGGYIAVLTDGVEWFSAELINDPEEWTRIHSGISQLAISHLAVAAAVNGYADEATARRDAEKRITQDREARTR